ncbi:MAG TPA: HlyD family efflux transporter periplasmic adaptor subunit [Prolixibacteraceae bacterium]|nr:HlyD family efflux transporter periplasmic adaptor subunit [Prolixibacteraceae bacterium]
MKRTIIIIVASIVIVAMAFGIMRYLASQKELPAVRESPEVTRYVKTVDVAYGDVIAEVKGKGRVVAKSMVDVVAEGSGKIIEGGVPLKASQRFKKGDVLFSIYKDEVELALKARKSNFLNAVANILPDIKIDFGKYYSSFDEFFSSINVDNDLPNLPQFDSSQLKMFLASRNILPEYYSIKKDELALKRYTVYAPFDGSFSRVNREVGAYVNMGTAVAMAMRTDVVELEVAVDADYAGFIEIGDEALIRGESTWKGTIVRKSDFIDEQTQSAVVYVEITEGDLPLPGQYLEASFSGKKLNNVMEVPRKAVFNFDEVYTIVDGRLKTREVNVIKRNEGTLLFNGLEAGTVLVSQPLVGVSEGSKVSRLRNAPEK